MTGRCWNCGLEREYATREEWERDHDHYGPCGHSEEERRNPDTHGMYGCQGVRFCGEFVLVETVAT